MSNLPHVRSGKLQALAVTTAKRSAALPDLPTIAESGIERVYAIREAVGPDIKVMVDCHWRFDETSALELMHELKDARLYWLECPISENPDHYVAIGRLRKKCNAMGMKLAGAERQSRPATRLIGIKRK